MLSWSIFLSLREDQRVAPTGSTWKVAGAMERARTAATNLQSLPRCYRLRPHEEIPESEGAPERKRPSLPLFMGAWLRHTRQMEPLGRKWGYTLGLWVPDLEFFLLRHVKVTPSLSSHRMHLLKGKSMGAEAFLEHLSRSNPMCPNFTSSTSFPSSLCHPLLLPFSLLQIILESLPSVEPPLGSGASLILSVPFYKQVGPDCPPHPITEWL